MIVNGRNFESGTVVSVVGVSLTTTFVSTSQLQGEGAVTNSGTAIPVIVISPVGGTSAAYSIHVESSDAGSIVHASRSERPLLPVVW